MLWLHYFLKVNKYQYHNWKLLDLANLSTTKQGDNVLSSVHPSARQSISQHSPQLIDMVSAYNRLQTVLDVH